MKITINVIGADSGLIERLVAAANRRLQPKLSRLRRRSAGTTTRASAKSTALGVSPLGLRLGQMASTRPAGSAPPLQSSIGDGTASAAPAAVPDPFSADASAAFDGAADIGTSFQPDTP